MGLIKESLSGQMISGLRFAFLVEADGRCHHQGGDRGAIVQSIELVRQIYDIVDLPEMEVVMVASDSQLFYAMIKPTAVAGMVAAIEANTREIQLWLENLLGQPQAGVATGSREALSRIKKLTTEYLKDFADMVLMVQIKQAGVNEADPSRESLEKLVAGLEKASLMILGPSLAKEMTNKLQDLLK